MASEAVVHTHTERFLEEEVASVLVFGARIAVVIPRIDMKGCVDVLADLERKVVLPLEGGVSEVAVPVETCAPVDILGERPTGTGRDRGSPFVIGLVAGAHAEVGGQSLTFHIAHGIGNGGHLEGTIELFLEKTEL